MKKPDASTPPPASETQKYKIFRKGKKPTNGEVVRKHQARLDGDKKK